MISPVEVYKLHNGEGEVPKWFIKLIANVREEERDRACKIVTEVTEAAIKIKPIII